MKGLNTLVPRKNPKAAPHQTWRPERETNSPGARRRTSAPRYRGGSASGHVGLWHPDETRRRRTGPCEKKPGTGELAARLTSNKFRACRLRAVVDSGDELTQKSEPGEVSSGSC